MKVSKEVLNRFIEFGNRYYEHMRKCLQVNIRHDFDSDKLHTKNWNLFFSEMHKLFGDDFGDLLYELIKYARYNDLSVDNIVAALRAMNVEVED